MCESENRTNNQNKLIDIEQAFTKPESSDSYKFYYHKDKELISSWEQLRTFYYQTFSEDKWLFRGDSGIWEYGDPKPPMREAFKTSLDKAFEEFEVKPQDIAKIEKAIIRSFRRRAHLLTDDRNNTQNQLEALALLRHHGAPARILDWMYSFFPAVYLAMNREYNKKSEYTTYTIWALSRKWLHEENVLFENKIFLEDDGYLNEHSLKKKRLKYCQKYDNNTFQKFVVTYIINKNPKSLIYAANPYRLNERLAAQRGSLLFSGTVNRTWGENLRNMINKTLRNRQNMKDDEKTTGPLLCEIPFRLSKKERRTFLRGLDEMNINQATLFPDIDGFAESLRTRIAHPESLGIEVS